MDASTLYFRFEFEDGADGEALARELQNRLARLDTVAEASAREERMRITGAEVVAAIAVGVLVVRGSRQLVQEINLLLTEVAGMVRNIKGLTSGSVEVDGRAVALAEVDEKDVATLAGD
jgi:hypothetical protein